MSPFLPRLLALLAFCSVSCFALDYPASTGEPQPSGWPISEAERAFVLRPEHERRPGAEKNQHLPRLWPSVPSAGNWGGSAWLDLHEKLVKTAQANRGPVDFLLVGDSITMQWGAAWQKHFGQYKTVNLGIGGDKTQNVLWRLDHGGVEGLQPRVIVLMIGNNNMFFAAETGIEAAARGIQTCAENLLEKFPSAQLILAKILPAHAPGNRFYEDIRLTNAALDALQLQSNPRIHVLDFHGDMLQSDGALKAGLFSADNIHLTQDGGYELYASKLKPLAEKLLKASQ
jgi:platelet-activating factor acetylhydrolase IB subunit beta/gamma